MAKAAGRSFNADIAAGTLALCGIAGFVLAAIFPLLRIGSSGLTEVIFSARTLYILQFTLWQAFLSTALSILCAIPVASALARRPQFPGRIWIVRLMAAPMGLPALVGAFGILAVWGRQGILNDGLNALGFERPISIYGLSGILVAHVFFNWPLAARLILAGLERLPPQYWRLSVSLGMGSWQIFRFVEWPAILRLLPGIAGLIFMLCATSFTLVLLLGGGPASTTLEVAIYQALKFDFDPPLAVALSLLQVGLMGLLLAALSLMPSAQEDRALTQMGYRRYDGAGLSMRLLDGVFILALVVFCASPLVAVAAKGVSASIVDLTARPLFWRAAGTSALIAGSAALISVFLAYCLSVARFTLGENKAGYARLLSALMSGAGSLILVVPPVVLATGWFLVLRGRGESLPIILVTIINALMALPFAIRVLEPAIVSHRLRVERLAQSLGILGLARLRIVDWPVLRKPLAMGWAFAAALSLGDLGAVALFGGNQIVTLPWLMYSSLGSYRSDDAAAIAFLLAIICLTLAIAGAPRGTQEKAI
ncbi:thiamine/thiamine pyrophosphate ABC transporter permease [Rhizobium sp. L1K21]|uniref:thiamine/thiamine pyrophosphate ABC transporter permease n=1 Tax=Rhizobium sp. L1K21 TaxID=2954933 RepID=UPI00209324BE|nr:thiamine/thiamine pyrophosphate ABC transporter permease [Rhizobium sp. L1K21]MCO6188061.1 thiamine/thiamine pyrophosphate ABC transporter permease [Rhizobium sp. L1K21]